MSLIIKKAAKCDIKRIIELRTENHEYYYGYETRYLPDCEEVQTKKIENMLEKDDIYGIYVVKNEMGNIVAEFGFTFAIFRSGFTTLICNVGKEYIKEHGIQVMKMAAEMCFLNLNYNKLNMHLRTSKSDVLDIVSKAGFKMESCYKQHFYNNGKYEDIIHMGLTREDYLNGSKGDDIDISQYVPKIDNDYKLNVNVSPTEQLIYGEKIDLTEYREEDAQVMYKSSYGSDEKSLGGVCATGPSSLKDYESYLSETNNYFEIRKNLNFAMRLKDGKFVGGIGANMIDVRNRNFMIGLSIIDKEYRGKGYGSEAIRLLCDFAFLELNMHRVHLGCYAFNEKAVRLYQYLGFTVEGVNRAFVYRNGRYYDECVMGLLREDWLRLRGYLDE